jgi:hypothetical protein
MFIVVVANSFLGEKKCAYQKAGNCSLKHVGEGKWSRQENQR